MSDNDQNVRKSLVDENLIHSSENDEVANDNDDASVAVEGIRTDQRSVPYATLPEQQLSDEIGTGSTNFPESEAPKRRLSTPCLAPLQSPETEIRVSTSDEFCFVWSKNFYDFRLSFTATSAGRQQGTIPIDKAVLSRFVR